MFEVRASFLRTLLLFGALGGLALVAIAGGQAALHADTTLRASLSNNLPYYLLWLSIVPLTYLFRRHAFVRIDATRLYSRFAPARPVQSVPLSSVSTTILVSPPVRAYLASGLKFTSPEGQTATIAVLLFSRQQRQALAEAIERALRLNTSVSVQE